jgi:ferric-dicitrate binding protein FerR (iron transport regulator)
MADHLNPTPPDDDRSERFVVLVARYFDGNLDEAEMTELNALLRADPECRRLFAEYCTRGCLIGETLDSERQRARLPLDEEPDSNDTQPSRVRLRPKRVVLLAGVAGLLVTAATLTFLFWPSHPVPEEIQTAVVGAVEPGSGDVRVITPDGQVRVIAARTEIHDGDTVRTEPLRGAAAVVYPDGTRLTLSGDTGVTCSGNVHKRVVVHQGMVGASVNPQPEGHPMVLTTPAARIEVRGTEFYCLALPDRTDVTVTKGSVRVVRTSDGKAVDVPEGKRVLAEAQAALVVEDIPQVLDTWDLDFEQGLPADMQRARLVTEGLPRGSKGGAAAVRSTRMGEEDFFELALPEKWQQGLFTFHPDSHLHVTYKMDRPDWVNLFICVRGAGPNGAFVGNYLFKEPEFYAQAKPGKWRIAVIPLSKLRRAGTGSDARPGADEVPYLLLFSSQGDRGLVIDRVLVTRDGPGVVQYRDVE